MGLLALIGLWSTWMNSCRFMTLNLQSRDLYAAAASSSEMSTPTSPTFTYAPDCPQLMSPERRRASHARNGFEGPTSLQQQQQQQLKSGFRLATNSPRASGDFYRGSPIRNSPKLELELMELANLPSAPTFAMRNLHTRPGKLWYHFRSGAEAPHPDFSGGTSSGFLRENLKQEELFFDDDCDSVWSESKIRVTAGTGIFETKPKIVGGKKNKTEI